MHEFKIFQVSQCTKYAYINIREYIYKQQIDQYILSSDNITFENGGMVLGFFVFQTKIHRCIEKGRKSNDTKIKKISLKNNKPLRLRV